MKKRRYTMQAIVIAVTYVILTVIADMFGMAKGIVQFRISDALSIMPYFTPAAIPGLFIGCLASNTIISITKDPMTGKMMISTAAQAYILFGSLATLFASIFSYILKKHKFLVWIPPFVVNTIVVPCLFKYSYRFEGSLLGFMVIIGIGEMVACCIFGIALLLGLEDYRAKLFPEQGEGAEASEEQ